MNPLKCHIADGGLTIMLDGRLDSNTTKEVEKAIFDRIGKSKPVAIVLDCEKLGLISSAGLRMVLRIKQTIENTRFINVSPEVFDILQTTGFTELMDVQRAYRVISVRDCEKIGEGANGLCAGRAHSNLLRRGAPG